MFVEKELDATFVRVSEGLEITGLNEILQRLFTYARQK